MNSDCIGCGYCCSVATCGLGLKAYGVHTTLCPGLVWDKESNRHWCKLAQMKGQLGVDYRSELYIGSGCSSTLFNEWREDIRDRTVKEVVKEVRLDKYFALFVHALSKQWMGGDLKSLIVMMWEHQLREAEVDEDTIDGLIKEVYYILTQGMPSYPLSLPGFHHHQFP
jgi:hypothetical protein